MSDSDPVYLKVGYKNYEIMRIDPRGFESNLVHGYCDHARGIIKIAEGDDPAHEAMVMLHESMHAAVDVFNIQTEDSEHEEYLVRSFANALSTMIADNPGIFMEIVAALSGGVISFDGDDEGPEEGDTVH